MRAASITAALVVIAMTAQAQEFTPLEPYPVYKHETIDQQPWRVGELLCSDDFAGDLSQWVWEGDVQPRIVPTHVYRFCLVYFNGLVQFIRDGEVIFQLQDPEAYAAGQFGLRITRNREFVDNFRVHRLPPK